MFHNFWSKQECDRIAHEDEPLQFSAGRSRARTGPTLRNRQAMDRSDHVQSQKGLNIPKSGTVDRILPFNRFHLEPSTTTMSPA